MFFESLPKQHIFRLRRKALRSSRPHVRIVTISFSGYFFYPTQNLTINIILQPYRHVNSHFVIHFFIPPAITFRAFLTRKKAQRRGEKCIMYEYIRWRAELRENVADYVRLKRMTMTMDRHCQCDVLEIRVLNQSH